MASITIQQLGPTDINTTKNLTMVSFAGDLDQVSIEQDSDKVEKLIKEVPDGSIMLFDFSNLMYINSRSISHLVNWYMVLEKKMSKLILFALRPNILDILDTTGITNLIPIFNNFIEVQAAIEQNQISFGDAPTSMESIGPTDPISGEINRPEAAHIEAIQASTEPTPTRIVFGEDEAKVEETTTNTTNQNSTPSETEEETIHNNTPEVEVETQTTTSTSAPAESTPESSGSITRPTPETTKAITNQETPANTPTVASNNNSLSIQRKIPTEVAETPKEETTNETDESQTNSGKTLAINRFSAPKETAHSQTEENTATPQTLSTPTQPNQASVPAQANTQAEIVAPSIPVNTEETSPNLDSDTESENTDNQVDQTNPEPISDESEEFKILED